MTLADDKSKELIDLIQDIDRLPDRDKFPILEGAYVDIGSRIKVQYERAKHG